MIDFISLQSRGCLGCHDRTKLVSSLDGPPRGVNGAVNRPNISEDLWTTSTCDMENSAVQSQGSISSISLANNAFDSNSLPGSSTNPSEFVNHGVRLWGQTRQSWIGIKKTGGRSQQQQEPKLNWNATYDSLLGSNKPFPQRIPLCEMVDFLVDVWEQEGLYD